jgi:hypothetical protein
LPDKEVAFWYVERGQPGYDSFGRYPLEERLTMGGHVLKAHTDPDGKAYIDLSNLDAIRDPHHSIQLLARFNADRVYPEYQPCQTCQFEFYSRWFQDPPL